MKKLLFICSFIIIYTLNLSSQNFKNVSDYQIAKNVNNNLEFILPYQDLLIELENKLELPLSSLESCRISKFQEMNYLSLSFNSGVRASIQLIYNEETHIYRCGYTTCSTSGCSASTTDCQVSGKGCTPCSSDCTVTDVKDGIY